MACVNVVIGEEFTLGVWRVEETEEELKSLVGGTYFPGLERMSHPRRRVEWLGARCLLKEFGLKSQVMYHPSRRPFLAHSKTHLSISHSYPYVAVIVSPRFFVGIDIESSTRPFRLVANKFLSTRESRWVDVANANMLSLIWSAKEAVYKLPGMEGIMAPEMNLSPFLPDPEKGGLELSIHLRSMAQRFALNYYFIEKYNVVWVCSDSKELVW